MRPHISSDEAHRIAFGFSPPDGLYFATRLRDGLGERGARPAGQGPSGSSAPGKQRIHRQATAGELERRIGPRLGDPLGGLFTAHPLIIQQYQDVVDYIGGEGVRRSIGLSPPSITDMQQMRVLESKLAHLIRQRAPERLASVV